MRIDSNRPSGLEYTRSRILHQVLDKSYIQMLLQDVGRVLDSFCKPSVRGRKNVPEPVDDVCRNGHQTTLCSEKSQPPMQPDGLNVVHRSIHGFHLTRTHTPFTTGTRAGPLRLLSA